MYVGTQPVEVKTRGEKGRDGREGERERQRGVNPAQRGITRDPGSVHGPWWSTYHNVISIPPSSTPIPIYIRISFFRTCELEPLGIADGGQRRTMCTTQPHLLFFSPRHNGNFIYMKSYFPNSISSRRHHHDYFFSPLLPLEFFQVYLSIYLFIYFSFSHEKSSYERRRWTS